MVSYQQKLAEDRRLVILKLLLEDQDYTANDRMLQTALEMLGHNETLATVQADLVHLQQVGAVSYEIVHGNIYVATLQRAGKDHVERRSTLPGVKRASPPGGI